MKINHLSVFFPAYNEEKNISLTLEKALKIIPQVADQWEIFVVDDGSKDKTCQIVKQFSNVCLISHPTNRGYGEALKSGFYQAKYDWIAFTDADGQFDINEINNFLEKTDQADLIVGYRLNRRDSLIRKIFGWSWTQLANLLLGIRVRDVDCGFKLINKKVIEKIPKLESTRGAMISPELLAKAKKAGFKILEVGVHHYPRKTGKQTGADFKVIINSFKDLIKLWWQLR